MPEFTPQPNRCRIVIRGFGLLTPLGRSAWETFAALLAGRTLADRAPALPEKTDPVALARAVGAVSVAQHSPADPTIELAERAAREAATAAGVRPANLPAFLGTSKGAVQALTVAADAGFARREIRNPLPVTLGPQGYLTHALRQRLGLGPARHHVAACASSLTALHAARQYLLDPRSASDRYALVATAEAALLPSFVHSYRRLGVLATPTPDGYRQRPLNADRQGFMLTEAGGAMLLERVEADQPPAPGEIELCATGVASEGYDLMRTGPDMPALEHLARRLFAGRTIDVLHPHATGTPDHDPAELAALRRAMDTSASADGVQLYACKGAIGHGLGAAGLSALILACLCLQTGKLPPMPWIDQPLPDAPWPIAPAARPCSRTGTHATFAAGFGGHVAGAVISRC
ncbi:MAG: beta-ketoacyl synthase N-terminal-like domain-containing protein [Phycisphaeraceae bacterium]